MDVLAHGPPGTPSLALDMALPAVLLILVPSCRRLCDRVVLLLVVVALSVSALPPLHTVAHQSVTGHMVQHLVLLLVAAPGLGVVAARAPSRLRSRAGLRFASRFAITHPITPLVAGGVHALVVALWHLPGPYDAAVANWVLHGVEHLTLVSTGAWWWSALVHHAPRRSPGAVVVSATLVATVGAAVGVLMMFAPRPLFDQGGVADQQTAGAIMAGLMGLALGATALWSAARVIERLTSPRPVRAPARVLAAQRGASSLVVVVACLTVSLGVVVMMGPVTGTGGGGTVASAATQQADSDRAGDTDRGRVLYSRDCAWCHGIDGGGTEWAMAITDVGTASVTYALETGRMPIDRPDSAIGRGEPAYDGQEVRDLVSYLDQLTTGPAARTLGLDDAQVARGGEHYRLNCAACHGAEGIGGALTTDEVTPSLMHASPDDVANAVVAGPGAMPSFDASFDEQALADTAAYVQHLQDPGGPGIAVPGGRVGEGLVAWVVGLGILVLGSRWLGRSEG